MGLAGFREIRHSLLDLANRFCCMRVTKIEKLSANSPEEDQRARMPETPERPNPVTSDAPQAWYVMLQDEAAAGKVIVPLKPFLRFSRRMDKQLARLERRIQKAIPQLKKRKQLGRGRNTGF